jgi:1-deoxy-D-xylulose-5-phosphate reductoisomerase
VAMFLHRQIGYTDIVDLIEKCMDAHTVSKDPSLDEILDTEQWVYRFIDRLCL